jgi:hypothetical protein
LQKSTMTHHSKQPELFASIPPVMLMLSNQPQAIELLSQAKRLGVSSPEAWAAQVLHAVQKTEHADQPLLMAYGAALQIHLRALKSALAPARKAQVVNEIQTLVSQLHAALRRQVPDDFLTEWRRTDAEVLVAFNNPTHWTTTANGQFAPAAGKLQNESASLWRHLKIKFGASLVNILFDAYVRGGVALVIAAMNRWLGHETTPLALTFTDLAHFYFVAISSSRGINDEPTWEDFSAHDGEHLVGYGVNQFQEHLGDTVRSRTNEIFNPTEGLVPAPKLPLAQLPESSLDFIHDLIGFTRSTWKGWIGIEYALAPVLPLQQQEQLSWIELWPQGNPAGGAREAEQLLEAHGFLAPLNVESRTHIKKLLYGTSPSTLQGILTTFDGHVEGAAANDAFRAWITRLATTLQTETLKNAPSQRHFDILLERSLALGLIFARASKDIFTLQQFEFMQISDLPAAIQTVNLRVEFPAALREVQQTFFPHP